MSRFLPGRDARALRLPGPEGTRRADGLRVVVIGGGIAGLSAAAVLAERGVSVDLVEREDSFGGRVRAWPVGGGRTMSRGFHAFFRQYYNLRSLLRRADPALERLVPVADYPLQSADGPRDSFRRLPRRPPWNLAGFVLRSPSFPLGALRHVDVATALELVRAEFPHTLERYDPVSAAAFLDRLRFPARARHLALEVFSRSFFAPPEHFSAGEMIAMFHSYFTGSAEGLLFDVPDDDYDTALWAPLVAWLVRRGVHCHTGSSVEGISLTPGPGERLTVRASTTTLHADAVVLAADPRSARALLADCASAAPGWSAWRDRIARLRNAPPFAVWRLWLDRPAPDTLPVFLGTSGFHGLDNVSVLDRFEAGAATWAARTGGSVVEVHAYALDKDADALPQDEKVAGSLRGRLWNSLLRIAPAIAEAAVVHEEWLVRDDCPLLCPGSLPDRPGVRSPDPRLVLAGDWLRTDEPVALMERAATTGLQAANALLARHGVAGHDVWTVPPRGLAARHRFARAAR